METDNLLQQFKLVKLGLAPNDAKKPIVLILFEQGCEKYLCDVKYGVLEGGCAAVFATLPAIDGFNANKAAREMLLPTRESIADLTESLLSLYRADGAVVLASSDICLAGAVMGAVRKNMPFAALPVVSICHDFDPLLLRSMAECGKVGLFAAEEQLNSLSGRIDDFFSLAMFLEASGAAVYGTIKENKTVLARKTGKLAAFRASGLMLPKRDFGLSGFETGLCVLISGHGTCSSMLHIVAIAQENGLNIDFEHICNLAQKTPLADLGSSTIDYAAQLTQIGVGGLLKSLINKKIIQAGATGYLAEAICGTECEECSVTFVGESLIARLKGNVANDCLARFNGTLKSFKGSVRAYESEELALGAIYGGVDFNDCALVITGQSAKNNGMPPIDVESALIAVDAQNTIIITDGRLVEFGVYPTVSLIEKTDTFDIIRSGDTLEIDFKKGKLNLSISNKESTLRLKKSPPLFSPSATLMRYAELVSPPSSGCTLKK